MIGKTISHYKILEKLGEGGMGVVYKAQDTKLDRFVALKFLPPHISMNEDEKKRFIHEAKATSSLEHPNICNIHEIDESDDGQTYIAMAYYEGETLKDKIERGPLPIDEAINFAIQIANGLARAHEADIIHRDIKPANIMITDRSEVKIVDFGLAKAAGRTKLTKENSTLGTVDYMSPEQTQGVEVDHRTDIWSLSVVLYEMITGQTPFKGDYEQAIMYSIMNEDAQPITALRTGVPMELERIINKCLEKDTTERYQTTTDLLVDLRRVQKVISEPGSQARVVSVQRRDNRPTRKWLFAGLLIVLTAIVVGIATHFLMPGKMESSDSRKMIVVLPFENLGMPEDEYFAAGMTEELTSRLATIKALGVISRYSALHYAETDKTIKQIGVELGVEYVLEGTVRWARVTEGGSKIRITPQLIKISDDTHLWTHTYDRVIDDIFEIQSEIAQKVVTELGITLLEVERRAVGIRPSGNLEAYQAYLRGRYFAGRPHFSLENWRRVIASYQKAVELDPGFALAHAELSKAHSRLYYLRHDLSEERREMAGKAAQRALELGPNSPHVHLALSYYYLWAYRDVDKTLEELVLAEEILSNNAEILETKANIFKLQGRWEEALNHFERAFEHNPRSAALAIGIAEAMWTTRKYQQAIDACNQAIALVPDAVWPYLYKIFTYWSWKAATEDARVTLEALPADNEWVIWTWFWQEIYEGNYREAIARLSSSSSEWIRLKTWARPKSMFSAFVYEFLNEPQLARRDYETACSMLENEIATHSDDPRYHSSLGIAYAALGRKEEAIREGKRAVELLPVTKDAFYALPYVQDLAQIYMLVGDYNKALDQIEYLLSTPSWFSAAWLKIDPRWNTLSSHPRLQELLKKYSGVD